MYKLWRSSYSNFGNKLNPQSQDDEIFQALEIYSENELKKISDSGFNAIWLHGVLRHLVKVAPFPELGKEYEKQVEMFQTLIKRAEKFNIKIFIHIQPLRSLADNDVFWEKHPDIKGELTTCDGFIDSEPMRAFCTSAAQVQEWLKNATQQLAQNLPALGGLLLISASEFPAHCYSHRTALDRPSQYAKPITCPRCKKRSPEEVVNELIELLYSGIRSVSDKIELVVWNWSWSWHEDSYEKIISNLPKRVILQAGFERGGHRDLLRRKNYSIDEYSLSYDGPSERFKENLELAQKHNLRVMSKLQLSTTHELATVVSLPFINNIYRKALFHKQNSIKNYSGCWNFGNAIPCANVSAFNFFINPDCPGEQKQAILAFAQKYFNIGLEKASIITMAWDIFDQAAQYYPFTIAMLYHGPQAHTLAYYELYRPRPLSGKATGPSTWITERGDDLTDSYNNDHKQFTLDEVIERWGKLNVSWHSGVMLLKKALNSGKELGNAIICGAIWRSTENSYRIYKLRKNWNISMLEEYNRIKTDELENLKSVLPWVAQDERQGYHIEAHDYMFNAEMIEKKIKILES